MRWALAGHGDLASRIVHAVRANGQQLDAVWGRDAERARAFADRHGIGQAGPDATQLFSEVDAVYVATPVVSHVELARQALLCNCHVVTEKPVSPNLGSPDPLLGLSERRARIVGVAYYRRLFAGARRIATLLRTGPYGRPLAVHVRWSGPFDPRPDDPRRWRVDPALAGAGVLADAGSHRIDLLVWWLGRPDRVRASLSERFLAGAERRAALELSWRGVTTGAVELRWANEIEDVIEMTFENGRLRWDLHEARLRWDGHREEWEELHPVAANPHLGLVADFVSAVVEARPPVCPLAEAIVTDQVIEAALRSDGRGHAWEPVRPRLGG